MATRHLMIIAAATMALVLGACGTKRAATVDTAYQASTAQQPTTSTRLSAIAEATGTWTTLRASGTIGISGASNMSSKMQMSMERGKSIYISLRPLLGIEVGRLVVVGDSVIVVDKLHKRYIAANASLLTGGVPVDVTVLQDIFLGRPFVLGEGTFSKSLIGKVKMTNVDGTMVMEPRNQYAGFTYSFAFDGNNRIKSADVTPAGAQTTTYSVTYGDVESTEAGNVAGSVSASSTVKGKAYTLSIDYSGKNWNESVRIDTKIPSGYTRIDSKMLLSLLGSDN